MRNVAMILLLLSWLSIPSHAQPPTDALLGSWNFNGNVNDASDKGHQSEPTAITYTVDRFGNPQSAAVFDGDNSMIVVDDPESNLTFDARAESYSASVWVYFTSIPNRHIHVFQDKWIDGGWSCYLNMDGYNDRLFISAGDGSNGDGVLSSNPIQSMHWYHVIKMVNGGEASIYVDGMLAGTFTVPQNIGSTKSTHGKFVIGSFVNDDGGFVDRMVGYVDDLRIYHKALTPAEIASLFHENGWQTGTVEGIITANCRPLAGVIVKLLDENGQPVAGFDQKTTDVAGKYAFLDVPPCDHQVMLVEPLGYSADQNPKPVTVSANATSVVNFTLAYTILSDRAEKWSYWKNQFDKVVKGKKSEETPQDLTSYIGTIQEHYTPHFNFFSFSSYGEWQQVLSKPTHPTKRDDALAEVAALVLNFGSLKLGQYTVITEDGRTASEVLTYVSELIGNPSSTDIDLEQAKKIAAKANHGDNQKIKAGEVPSSSVLYKSTMKRIEWNTETPNAYALSNNYPNPFNPSTTIQYDLPNAGLVSLKVYDYIGKEVATLVNGEVSAGRHSVRFEPSNLASGMYFYRIQAGDFVQIRRCLFLK